MVKKNRHFAVPGGQQEQSATFDRIGRFKMQLECSITTFLSKTRNIIHPNLKFADFLEYLREYHRASSGPESGQITEQQSLDRLIHRQVIPGRFLAHFKILTLHFLIAFWQTIFRFIV